MWVLGFEGEVPSFVGEVELEVEEVVEVQVGEVLVVIVPVVVWVVEDLEVAIVERSSDENLVRTRSRS